MKRGLKSQQSSFTKLKTEQEAATRASFRVALEIGKPFTDGEMIKECIIAVSEEMCEKVNLLKTVSMSANTVARRVENIAENISFRLFDKNGHVEWFSLALDESTDVSDTAQVLLYIRVVDKSYEVHEELLDMYSIHGTTTGRDIFKGVEMAINQKNLRWKNLKCITTDGGKNMSGKDKGVVDLVSKAVENDGGSKLLVLHCIIHQQSLCGKCLDMSEVLKPVISTVNFIRSFGLNHPQFIEEIGENDLPYHTAKVCSLCLNKINIEKKRQVAEECLVIQATKVKLQSGKSYFEASVGTTVRIPEVDRGRRYARSMLAVMENTGEGFF
ncbi:SCAN domain-containing protein 3 [Trichonephila clavata]|uniref:SCAN domain-containing protein 3 n=1 Tax=Trichonephila clavata TaxID=2740835 RepID=A0A8X6M2W5_TRICU|nr:SCAN domain-containing protein 3 [Trichonephila clavata]